MLRSSSATCRSLGSGPDIGSYDEKVQPTRLFFEQSLRLRFQDGIEDTKKSKKPVHNTSAIQKWVTAPRRGAPMLGKITMTFS